MYRAGMTGMDAFKERVLRDALSFACSPDASTRERGMAARIAAEVVDHVAPWTEARAADVARALQHAVTVRFDACSAVETLVHVLRRKEGDRVERIAGAIARTAQLAFDRRKFMSLRELLLVMLDDDELSKHVEASWVAAAVRHHAVRPIAADRYAGALLHLYVERFGTGHAWIADVVREHAGDILASHWLDFDAKQSLHYVAPTGEGWAYFVEFATEDVLAPWDAARFGERLPTAVETLQAVLGNAGERDAAKAVVLAEWLSRLLVLA